MNSYKELDLRSNYTRVISDKFESWIVHSRLSMNGASTRIKF